LQLAELKESRKLCAKQVEARELVAQELTTTAEALESERNAAENARLALEQQVSRLAGYEEQANTWEEACQQLRAELLTKEADLEAATLTSAAVVASVSTADSDETLAELAACHANITSLRAELGTATATVDRLTAELTVQTAAVSAMKTQLTEQAIATAQELVQAKQKVAAAEASSSGDMTTATQTIYGLKSDLQVNAAVIDRLTAALADLNNEAVRKISLCLFRALSVFCSQWRRQGTCSVTVL
jgi:chromosome segregation ATPase